jgi:NAD(P)-dependent dehydrogenase (short-subunit alcohol dehydrogenase family)
VAATLYTAWIAPNASTVAATTPSASDSRVRSAARHSARPPAATMRAARSRAASPVRAATITDAPSRPSASAAADLTRESDADGVVAATVEAFGAIHAVYNVAGISGRRFGDGPLHALTLAGWETVLTGNATSLFLVTRAAVRAMLDRAPDGEGARGAILNMSSVLAQHPVPEHFATHAYAASKGAIEAFSRAVAATYAPDGIRVNVIAPALVATPMSRRAQEDPAILAFVAAKQPLAGGPLATDAVTGTALFLLSDAARMVTGQVIAVDGGWSVS